MYSPCTRFILAVILYFSIGAVVMKYRYGATGSDIVPNKSFWVMLPFLVKVSEPHTLCVDISPIHEYTYGTRNCFIYQTTFILIGWMSVCSESVL